MKYPGLPVMFLAAFFLVTVTFKYAHASGMENLIGKQQENAVAKKVAIKKDIVTQLTCPKQLTLPGGSLLQGSIGAQLEPGRQVMVSQGEISGMFFGAGSSSGEIPAAALLYDYGPNQNIILGKLSGVYLSLAMASLYNDNFTSINLLDIPNFQNFLPIAFETQDVLTDVAGDWLYYSFKTLDTGTVLIYRWNILTNEQQLLYASDDIEGINAMDAGEYYLIFCSSFTNGGGEIVVINLENQQIKPIAHKDSGCFGAITAEEQREDLFWAAWSETDLCDNEGMEYNNVIKCNYIEYYNYSGGYWVLEISNISELGDLEDNEDGRRIDNLRYDGTWVAYSRNPKGRDGVQQLVIRNESTYEGTFPDEEQMQPTPSLQLCLDIDINAFNLDSEARHQIVKNNGYFDMIDGNVVIAYPWNNTCELYLYDIEHNAVGLLTQDASARHLFPRIGYSTVNEQGYYFAWTQNSWEPNVGGQVWGTAISPPVGVFRPVIAMPVIAVIVEKGIRPFIEEDLEVFISDLENSGYSVEIAEFDAWSKPEDVRNYLINLRHNQGGLQGAILVGNIPVLFFERYYMIEGGSYIHDVFPCASYYMDLDSEWADELSPGSSPTDPPVPVPNGILDTVSYSYPGLEIWTGFVRPEVPYCGNSMDLTIKYLQKNHDYRIGNLRLLHRGLDYEELFVPGGLSYLNLAYGATIVITDSEQTGKSDYLSRLVQNFEAVHLNCHSWHCFHQFQPGGNLYYDEIADINPMACFYLLNCCGSCDLTVANNLSAIYTFGSDYGLLTFGVTTSDGTWSTDSYYNLLGEGENFGAAFINWCNHNSGSITTHILIGDPTLKIARFQE